MFRQVRYFQSVVRNNSFSEAAEENHISQSAISQQIQALEQELGFMLLERKNRKFSLTPAGEYFYQKSLILVSDYERICRESAKIARGGKAVLRIGYLRCYSGNEFHRAVDLFTEKYPDVTVQIEYGNHEELYRLLESESVDIALNDQRRAFSDAYVNLLLTTSRSFIEISSRSPLAHLPGIAPDELKNIPCILVASQEEKETECEYYQKIIGFRGEFIFAGNLEEARLMVTAGKGFMPVEGNGQNFGFGASLSRIPLIRKEGQITRNYCAFWKKDNSGYLVEEFADLLKSQFSS